MFSRRPAQIACDHLTSDKLKAGCPACIAFERDEAQQEVDRLRVRMESIAANLDMRQPIENPGGVLRGIPERIREGLKP